MWKELREIAKRGLDDPALLADLEKLLKLPVVEGRAETFDSIGRARALVSVLSELFDDLLTDASTSRKELINCLFMLDDKWKGERIGAHRAYLADVRDGADTSTFRRDKEIPLYKELVRLLVERSSPTNIPPPQDRSEDQALSSLCESFSQCRWFIMYHRGESHSRAFGFPKPAREALFEYLMLQAEVANPTIGGNNLGFPPPELFPSEQAYNAFFSCLRLITPFTERELAVWRSQYSALGGETLLLREFLEETPEGKGFFKKWLDWLDACECDGGQSAEKTSCPVHGFLKFSATFLRLAGREDLVDREDPLDAMFRLARLRKQKFGLRIGKE